jgi:solute carrier family 20 (sodium-dependent phosphate transporter)
MWCTRHNAHVSSTYSLVSSIAGVGVATVGAKGVQWGWNKGQGLGAIFGGLVLAPFISGCFASVIFLLVKYVVHARKNPVPWAVWTSPFFFLIAGTICSLSIVYKGSPKLGLDKRPPWFIASVSVGTGVGLFILSSIFFVPYVHGKVVKRDRSLILWQFIYGPLLFKRPAPEGDNVARVPNYAVIQHGQTENTTDDSSDNGVTKVAYEPEKTNGDGVDTPPVGKPRTVEEAETAVRNDAQADYKLLLQQNIERHHEDLRQRPTPLGWAMRRLHNNPIGAGSIHERHNILAHLKRLPAYPVVALLYGLNYDIHKAQVGIEGTPEGNRMARTYSYAKKYPNEVEYLYSSLLAPLPSLTVPMMSVTQSVSGP